jgi:phage-related minor tail protein
MAFNIGAVLTVNGENEYNRAMKGIQQNLKYVTAEMKKVTSEYNTNDKSVEALTKQNEVLEKVLAEQRTAVEKTRAELDRMVDAGLDPASDAYKRLKSNLNYAEAALNDTKRQIQQNIQAIDDARKETLQLGQASIDAAADTEDAGQDMQGTFSDIGKAIGGPVGTVISKFDDMIGAIGTANGDTAAAAAAMGLSWAGVAAGVAAVVGEIAKIGKEAYAQMRELKVIAAEFEISLGLSEEEAAALTDIGKRIYAEGFAKSLSDAINALKITKAYLRDLDDATLEQISGQASALADIFDVDIKSIIKTSSTMMDTFEMDAQKTVDLIAALLSKNPAEAGEFLDTLNEYSVKFDEMGYSAEEFATYLAVSMENGAWSVDKVADAIKTLSDKSKDGSQSTKDALVSLGVDADAAMATIASGGDAAKAQIDIVLRLLSSMQDKYQQNLIGVALMGSQWEDVGSKAIFHLAAVQNQFTDIEGTAIRSAETISKANVTNYEQTMRKYEAEYGETLGSIQGTTAAGFQFAGEAAVRNAEGQQEAVDQIFEGIKSAWDTTVAWFKEILTPETREATAAVLDDGVTAAIMAEQPTVEAAGQDIGGAIIGGAVQGLKDNEAELIRQTTASFAKAANAARDALDIHSPSGVFKEIGGFVAKGFAIGIDNNLNQVLRASGDLARAAVPQAASVITPADTRSMLAAGGTTNITLKMDEYWFGRISKLLNQADRARQDSRARR